MPLKGKCMFHKRIASRRSSPTVMNLETRNVKASPSKRRRTVTMRFLLSNSFSLFIFVLLLCLFLTVCCFCFTLTFLNLLGCNLLLLSDVDGQTFKVVNDSLKTICGRARNILQEVFCLKNCNKMLRIWSSWSIGVRLVSRLSFRLCFCLCFRIGISIDYWLTYLWSHLTKTNFQIDNLSEKMLQFNNHF